MFENKLSLNFKFFLQLHLTSNKVHVTAYHKFSNLYLDAVYAEKCRSAATEIYNFGIKHPGNYKFHARDSAFWYNYNHDYHDEMVSVLMKIIMTDPIYKYLCVTDLGGYLALSCDRGGALSKHKQGRLQQDESCF